MHQKFNFNKSKAFEISRNYENTLKTLTHLYQFVGNKKAARMTQQFLDDYIKYHDSRFQDTLDSIDWRNFCLLELRLIKYANDEINSVIEKFPP
ncbi:hypothetical protein KAU08_02035 [bacterium]|nr:hypothetical protein [bacterium]